MKHRNKHIGPFYVVCRSEGYWRVEYNGQVLYTKRFRYQAVDKAKKLLKAYNKLLEEGGAFLFPPEEVSL